MTVSESQKRASKKYTDAKYGQIRLAASKEEIASIKDAAKAAGLSTNGYIRTACKEKMEREGFSTVTNKGSNE